MLGERKGIQRKAALQKKYLFCSAAFEQGSKNFYYLTDGKNLSAGNLVSVLADQNAHKAIVKVVKSKDLKGKDTPMHVKKIKQIIRKGIDADISRYSR